jgi:hypothetical protein
VVPGAENEARARRVCGYKRRWQAETVNSMMKRNLSSALRGKSDASRRRDLKLKVLVHDLMILHRRRRVETGIPVSFNSFFVSSIVE